MASKKSTPIYNNPSIQSVLEDLARTKTSKTTALCSPAKKNLKKGTPVYNNPSIQSVLEDQARTKTSKTTALCSPVKNSLKMTSKRVSSFTTTLPCILCSKTQQQPTQARQLRGCALERVFFPFGRHAYSAERAHFSGRSYHLAGVCAMLSGCADHVPACVQL